MNRHHASSHPDEPALIAHLGHQLALDKRLAVEAHLRLCSACRAEFEKLFAERRGGPVRPPLTATELPEILAAIRRHEVRRSGSQDPEICKRRAAAEIDAYLGPAATATILRNVSADGRNLLSEVQPVLSLFLGRRAASRLASRIVEVFVVRI